MHTTKTREEPSLLENRGISRLEKFKAGEVTYV